MRKVLIAGAALLTLLAAGCEAGPTVSADRLESLAAESLKQQVGADVLPEIDCGDDDIILVKDKVVDCVLTDPGTQQKYAAPVTITEVEGTTFKISVQVSSEPMG